MRQYAADAAHVDEFEAVRLWKLYSMDFNWESEKGVLMLPNEYAWLSKEPGPKMLIEALKLYGVEEKKGKENNPVILQWAKECGISWYNADEIPWCGLLMAIVAHRSGKPLPASPLWARSWAEWGDNSERAMLGDVLVFSRKGGGHVGLYVGEDSECFHVLGGNQSDKVCVKRIEKRRLIAARRLYKIGVPENVRVIRLSAEGEVSRNES